MILIIGFGAAFYAASIEVNRRLRHVKTDRLDGERLRRRDKANHMTVQCVGSRMDNSGRILGTTRRRPATE